MTSIVADWRIDLIKAHPNLFHPPTGAPETARGYPACGDGWRELLNCACERIAAALAEGDSFKAVQIQEKSASLRFYWRGRLSPEAEAKIVNAIALAEARSACTCDECGKEGRLYCNCGVLITRCAIHARGQPVEVAPTEQNVHIVRRVVAGKLRGISCCRYDRGTDTFVDVPPDSLRVEVHGEISSSTCEACGHD